MRRIWNRHWFLICLPIAMIASVLCSKYTPEFTQHVPAATSRSLTAGVLLLMSLSLDTRKFLQSMASPGPVLLASLINYGLLPLAAGGLSLLQLSDDLRIGLVIAGAVPCTLASASVWTREAGGNDAVSLLVTLVTNTLCVVVTPFWLWFLVGGETSLSLPGMIERLVYTVLIPVIAGQVLRRVPEVGPFATKYKARLSKVAMVGILSIVFLGLLGSGRLLLEQFAAGGVLLAILWGAVSCGLVHVLGLIVAYRTAKLMFRPVEDHIAVTFAGSQKTMPIGIYLASDPTLFSTTALPLLCLPILMFHIFQLFFDTWVVGRFQAARENVEH